MFAHVFGGKVTKSFQTFYIILQKNSIKFSVYFLYIPNDVFWWNCKRFICCTVNYEADFSQIVNSPHKYCLQLLFIRMITWGVDYLTGSIQRTEIQTSIIMWPSLQSKSSNDPKQLSKFMRLVKYKDVCFKLTIEKLSMKRKLCLG